MNLDLDSKVVSKGSRMKINDGRDDIMDGNPNHVVDWRGLFYVFSYQMLSFHPPQILDSKVVVSPSKDVIEKGAFLWKNSLVAQFISKVPNLVYFKDYLTPCGEQMEK